MRVGIICEGSTDFAVLRAVLPCVMTVHHCVMLQPRFDRLRDDSPADRPAPGWQGVRSFLRDYGDSLEAGTLDLVVVQVDASIRHLAEVASRLPTLDENSDDLSALCDHVRAWSPKDLPAFAAIVLPRESIESWLLAAHTNLKRVERVEDPTRQLIDKGLISQRGGRPNKTAATYEELSRALGRLLKNRNLPDRCPELARFVAKLETLRRRFR